MDRFRGKKVTVMGFARSGEAAARLLAEAGAQVTVSEARRQDETAGEVAELRERGVQFQFGGHEENTLLASDLIVLSPGVPAALPPLMKAGQAGVPVIGEVELASLFTSATIVGVTGSNGKSTTVTLLGEMLKGMGRPSIVAGNIGTPLCKIVRGLSPEHIVVTELSSFQLETIREFRCHVSVLLNVSPDHLDRYPGLREYAKAKARIFENQRESDYAVVNGDDEWSVSLSSGIKAERLLFRRKGGVEAGCFLLKGTLWFRWGGENREICPSSEIAIAGVHNLENAMAATIAASLLGVEPSGIRAALRSFQGLEHRLELVLEKDGVKFVNDSKGTNVGAVLKSLESFSSPIILIAGGRDKGSDFSPLAEMARGRVKAFLLMGEAKEKLKVALGDVAPVVEVTDMAEAVHRAVGLARRGDVVLLSPACASFDMFQNFEDRGRVFRNEVLNFFEGSRGGSGV